MKLAKNNSVTFATSVLSVALSAAVVLGVDQPLPKPVAPPPVLPGPRPATPNPAREGTGDQIVGEMPLAAGEDAAVQPFLDENTIGVLRADLAHLDVKAYRDWIVGMVDRAKIDAADVPAMKENLGKGFDEANGWLNDLKAAGAKRVYVVFSLSEIPDRPPLVIVPLEKDSDADGIIAHFRKGEPKGQPNGPVASGPAAEKIGQAVVFADADSLRRLKDAPASKRIANLGKAFAGGGGAPVRVALVPTDGTRQMLEAGVPELPADLGGGSIKVISRGIQWAGASLGAAPDVSLHVVVQAKDADAARSLQALADKAAEWAKAHGEDIPFDVKRFTELAKPKLEGDRLMISLEKDKAQEFAAAVVLPALFEARRTATFVQSASNMRQLLLGCISYAEEHKNSWPDKLEDCTKYLGGDKDSLDHLLTNPADSSQKPGYVYRKPTDLQTPSQSIVLYEAHSAWRNGINVGYADGHVEHLASEQEFNRQMKNAK